MAAATFVQGSCKTMCPPDEYEMYTDMNVFDTNLFYNFSLNFSEGKNITWCDLLRHLFCLL